MREQLVRYLDKTYNPAVILLMGSYADGTYDEVSDIDAMIFVEGPHKNKDDSVLNGVQLDVDIFAVDDALFADPSLFIKAHDPIILKDCGIAQMLIERIREYLESVRITEESEKEEIRSWINKMIFRIDKGDDDANYRLVMLLWENLWQYFLLRDLNYYGNKKAIRYLKENDPDGYRLFHKAITKKTPKHAKNWAEYVKKC